MIRVRWRARLVAGLSGARDTVPEVHLGNLEEREPFTTMDGSTIREIAGPTTLPSRHQSLAEATVPPAAQ
jgi:hypothetical protein